MLHRLTVIILVCLCAIALLTISTFAAQRVDKNGWKAAQYNTMNSRSKLAGAEKTGFSEPSNQTGSSQSLGFDGIKSTSPGLPIGTTTHDFQHNCRTNRQIDWRGTQSIHMIWFKQTTYGTGANSDGGTGYEVWDSETGWLAFEGAEGGGCNLHAPGGNNFSGYIGLDVDTEGKSVITNHAQEDGVTMRPTVWYDFAPINCNFSPYKRIIPDSLGKHGLPIDQINANEYFFLWPSMEYQVWDGDTVTHVVAHQSRAGLGDPEMSKYFRRIGSDTLGSWEYPPMIFDTVPVIGEFVTASRISGKVAIVWLAPPGAYPGSPESMIRDWVDPGLGVNQRTNDVYYMISNDMGASWESKANASAYDSTTGGYLAHGDVSALIDSKDTLHILWPARVIVPSTNGLGEYTNFWGSRLLHWDENTQEIRVVKDANWDIADDAINDSTCDGGAWNEMSIVKPQISECDNKFYAIFVQFLDLYNGNYADCANLRWGGAGYSGTANGELYVAVSSNGGYNWDLARNLTNSPSPSCDTAYNTTNPCESDQYPAMSRYGMDISLGGDFQDAPIVDPSGNYAGDFYLDVEYINDKFPGSVFQDAGVWTTNPVKWFRLPCVEPVPNPYLVVSPAEIAEPTWTKPGVQKDTSLLFENLGNAELHISAISIQYVSGSNWLGLSELGPLNISHLSPNNHAIDVYLNANMAITTAPHVYSASIVIEHDGLGMNQVPVTLIIADTVQFPEVASVRTSCTRLAFSNAGNFADQGASEGNGGNGGFSLNYFNDCDTTENRAGQDNHAGVYLYDGSPFIARMKGGQPVLDCYMYNADWLRNDGFRPLEGIFADSTTYPDYQYGYSGEFLTSDSAIGLECEYFAPIDPDSCDFVVMKQRIYNRTAATISNIYVGDLMDWDIPSDSGSENGSDYDAALKTMYMYGAEYGPDSLPNNDCVSENQRYGGFSYYGGFKLPHWDTVNQRFTSPRAMWTGMNADWVYPANGFVASEMYNKISTTTGYKLWQSTNPTMEDSLYQDLHMVSVFTQWSLAKTDTLVFVKILASEYNGGVTAFKQTITKARAWIASRPDIFTWPTPGTAPGCCDNALNQAGDADYNGAVNILDVGKIIGYLYKGQPAPTCKDRADADGNNAINILDVGRIIGYLYKGQAKPICGTTGT